MATYPKAMTIRYSQEQEKEIELMMEKLGTKTMSKAFLLAPSMMEKQNCLLISLKADNEKLKTELEQALQIISGWQQFNKRLTKFVGEKHETKQS